MLAEGIGLDVPEFVPEPVRETAVIPLGGGHPGGPVAQGQQHMLAEADPVRWRGDRRNHGSGHGTARTRNRFPGTGNREPAWFRAWFRRWFPANRNRPPGQFRNRFRFPVLRRRDDRHGMVGGHRGASSSGAHGLSSRHTSAGSSPRRSGIRAFGRRDA